MLSIFDFPPEQIIRKQLRFVSAGAATEHIDDDQAKPGRVNIFVRISIENKTSAFSSFRIGVWDGANFQLSEEQKSPAAATLYWTVDPIYVSEGGELRVELNGCASGDVIMVYIDGFFRGV